MTEVRYHISKKTGRPNQCRAQEGKCPLKTDDGKKLPHFETKEAARRYIEKENTEKYGETIKLKKTKKKNTPNKEKELTGQELTDIAFDNNASTSDIDKIVNSNSNGAKEMAAQRDDLTQEQVVKLSTEENRHIRAALAHSSNLLKTNTGLKSLIYDNDNYVRETAWENLENNIKEKPEVIENMVVSKDPNIRNIAAYSENIPQHLQSQLANDEDKNVRKSLSQNRWINHQTQKELIYSGRLESREYTESITKWTSDREILDRHCLDKNDNIVRNVANNIFTSDESLNKIISEKSIPEDIREIAEQKKIQRALEREFEEN